MARNDGTAKFIPPPISVSPPLSADDLPNNVCTEEQLALLPQECLSGDPERPLRHVDEMGEVTHYALQPMFYSVIFILLVELLERFSFYGIDYTQTSYLTGVYNDNWNAGMASVTASSYVSVSTAIAYTTPFAGAYLADTLIGDYWSIILGSSVYLPGILLIAATTVPHLLGKHFNSNALRFALLFLWPIGTGIVKSVVNVFGAKQYHPFLQSTLIETYFVNFYMCINIGALAGGTLIPIIAQHNVSIAYFIPVALLSLAVLTFLLGTPRYVRSKPKIDPFAKKLDDDGAGAGDLGAIFLISCLIIPFNIAYSQMATTFIVQGTVMQRELGFIDAASMNNADAISVLVFGYLIGAQLYPFLANRGYKVPTTHKFAFGSLLGALAIAWALLVEYKIHNEFEKTGQKISIFWQTMSYVLIGAGEIFCVSTAYEVAFTVAPPEKKALASAANLFCVLGIPNYICLVLYRACSPWFQNSKGNARIHRLSDYAEAKIYNYFFVLFIIAILGVGLNLLPCVRDFVMGVEEKATDMIKTPVLKKPKPGRPTEGSPLLRIKRHQAYLKFGSGPSIRRLGSLRAAPNLSQRKLENKEPRRLTYDSLSILYRREPNNNNSRLIAPSGGHPLVPGSALHRNLLRSSSADDVTNNGELPEL